MTFLISMAWLTSIMFLFLSHPLSFGMMLLIQALIVSIITGMMNYNFWFSYILFLVMVGGMLILFIYMTSIASNEKFKFSYKLLLLIMTMLLMSMFMMLLDFYFFNSNLMSYDLISQNQQPSNTMSMNKFLNWPSNLILAIVIIYLLITLIMVVKITNIQYGPLRQKF
nr:NADH dehydrogenase subunit 6 [Dorcasomus pinheyi]